jgi:hypothetical protein
MAEEKLRITITADNKDALAKFQQTIAGLDGVSASSGKAGGATAKLGTNFTGLSRVIQDLPYGFNAISNNLTQLVPAAGAAGLAFSGIVTALTFASIGFGAWTRGMGDSKKATEAATKANEEYLSSLAKEKVSLDTLFRTATNANVPLAARLDAVKQLRDNYGAYLKNFTDEEILAGKAAVAYRNLSAAIIQAARARAAQDQMVEKQKQILTLEQEVAKEKEVLERRKIEIQKEGTTVTQTTMGAVGQILTVQQKLALADEGFIAKTKQKTAAINVLNKEMQNLATQGQQNIVTPFKSPTEGKGGGGGKPKEVAVKDENKALEEQIQIYKRLQFAMMGQGTITQEKTKQKDLTNLKLTMDGNTALNQIKQQQIAIDDQLNARTELATKLTDRAMQGLAGVANAMANGGNIGEAFGNMFKQLAIDIALAAAKAAIFQAILSAINPVGGATKAGGFLKGFGKLLGFAQGGTVSGPQSGYPVMLHGTEHIVRPDQMKSIIASAAQMGGGGASKVIVEGRIQGQDIWLSQQRTNTFRGLTN